MQPLEQSLVDAWPFQSWTQTRLLVAVSGGADSVALLRALAAVTDRRELLDVAHFNHQWRGAESDADEEFVRALCDELSLRLTCVRAAEGCMPMPQRSEQAARQARYKFLAVAAASAGARYVVTAHTASDRIETLLHNLCRGTGLAGVSVPARFRNLTDELVLTRPLLHCWRSQVIAYLTAIGQAHRQDSSNLNTAFKRNYIRHQVLPLVRASYGEQVDKRLLDFSELAEEATQALRFYAENWLAESLTERATVGAVELASAAFGKAPWPVIKMALEKCWKQHDWPLQAMTRAHWDQIRDHALRPGTSANWQAKLNLPGKLRLSTSSSKVRIAPE